MIKLCKTCGAPVDGTDDEIESLFNLWKKMPGEFNMVSLGERILIEKIIMQFGKEKVRAAFIEASAEPGRMKISYVRGILKGEYQKSFTKKNVIEGNQLKNDLNKKEAAAGLGLPAVTELLKQLTPAPTQVNKNDDYKKSEEYLKKKKEYEESLKENRK